MSGPVDFQGATPSGSSRRLVLGVVAVVIALGLAIVKPWDGAPANPAPSSAVVTPAASPSAVPSAAPATPTPSPTLDLADFELPGHVPQAGERWRGLRWTSLAPGAAVTTFTSVTRWQGGWIALGRAGDGVPIVWTSQDGLAWARVDAGTGTTFWPGIRVIAAVPFKSGVLALGALHGGCAASSCATDPATGLQLSAWTSPDGTTWDPVAGALLDGVGVGADADVGLAATSAGLVLAVTPHDVARSPSLVYTSADGATWRQLPLVRLPGISVQAASGDAAAAYLSGSMIVDGQTSAVIARSSDLATWSVTRLPQAPGLPSPQTAWGVREGARGKLAVGSGSDSTGTELWWRSPDGLAWSSVTGYPPLGPTRCNDRSSTCGDAANGLVLADGQRLVALQLGDAVTAWTSSGDGQWTGLGSNDFGHVTQPSSAVLLPSGVVVVVAGGGWYGEATVAEGG